jgi:hypothetical protein
MLESQESPYTRSRENLAEILVAPDLVEEVMLGQKLSSASAELEFHSSPDATE